MKYEYNIIKVLFDNHVKSSIWDTAYMHNLIDAIIQHGDYAGTWVLDHGPISFINIKSLCNYSSKQNNK